ncbi:hypothetical protein RKD23_000575 [Streptomyces sp. SAI-170]|uniref:hypothetical protein n=1 Tax=Streptomyces sp. SAI-170 TaxID=3377729 RepID=UPI003C7DA50B
MTDAPPPPSPFLRAVLRADAFAVSTAGTMTLTIVLLTLLFIDSVVAVVAAVVVFAAWIAVGWTGRRYERMNR